MKDNTDYANDRGPVIMYMLLVKICAMRGVRGDRNPQDLMRSMSLNVYAKLSEICVARGPRLSRSIRNGFKL